MFKKQTPVTPATPTTPTETVLVDVESYAVSNGAQRIRRLEAEMQATFEEWAAAQKSAAQKDVLIEFKMSSPLTAAWAEWNAARYREETKP